MREGEFVDVEVGSRAELSCLPASIGADAYPLDETRLSMCGGHHVAAAANCMSSVPMEACDVRGDVVNMLVRFRVMDIGKAFLSTQDLSLCVWETVFLAEWRCQPCQESFRHSHHVCEEEMCLGSESEGQASQRLAIR